MKEKLILKNVKIQAEFSKESVVYNYREVKSDGVFEIKISLQINDLRIFVATNFFILSNISFPISFYCSLNFYYKLMPAVEVEIYFSCNIMQESVIFITLLRK